MKKILIANRGEIALRVIKTAKKMGIKTIAVYSEADRNSKHSRAADEAAFLGSSPSSESYLNIDKIIACAKERGADAIHPGYGFLSENATFARKVEENGMIFIGPSPYSITIMGSKLEAKAAVKNYNIPMVPGTDQPVTEINKAKEIASSIGYPILIKASAGGGGKGMRIVESEADFESQMSRAVSEAISAFGDGSVFIEKYITSPRHIEIQILADKHGNTIHLFERECSIQRRHQKVIEEAPSSILSPELRNEMGEAAIKVAKSCHYSGAGTVEFLVDESNNYYFLEMNTRLQVEHPVTEFITGIDLVEHQIRVARGEELSILQTDLKIKGHAIELRVYAEDPEKNFLPDIGELKQYEIPSGDGIRVDDGYEQGDEIPIYYDPMIAKLIAYGNDRHSAIANLKFAIDHYHISGVATTLKFGKFVCENKAFIDGQYDTHFINKYFSPEALIDENEEMAAAIAALKHYLEQQKKLKLIHHQNDNWLKRMKK